MKNGKYELIVAPPSYPGKLYRGRYCYEHHYVWWENTGEILQEGEVIHHKNGDHRDNEYSNLEKMSNSSHVAQHGTTGRTMAQLECPSCGRVFTRERRHTLAKTKHKFCSRECKTEFYRS